jgi:hypothetical protein
MRRRTNSIMAILLFVCTCRNLTAQAGGGETRDVEFYRRNGELMMSRIRQALRDQSSPGDRAVQDEITTTITPIGGVNGVAYQKSGRRYIEITAGFVEIIDWVATAQAITVITGQRECETRYDRYLGDAIGENTSLRSDNLALRMVTSPYQFYENNRPLCPHITPDQVNSNERASSMRTLVMNESLMLIYAHEVGHHIYNDPFSSASWCEQQKREARADAYSFKVLSGPDQSPLVAVPVLLIFATIEGFSGEDTGQTHPAALKRLLAMVDATRRQLDSDSELRSALQRTGRSAEFYRYIDQLESSTKTDLAAAGRNVCSGQAQGDSPGSGATPGMYAEQSGHENSDNSLSNSLRRLISSGGDFSQFKGGPDPDGDSTQWISNLTVPGAIECGVTIKRGYNAGQTFTCKMMQSHDFGEAANVYDRLVQSVTQALPPGWKQEEQSPSRLVRKNVEFKRSSKDPLISVDLSGTSRATVSFTMFSPDDN